jgi:hypothetical protein
MLIVGTYTSLVEVDFSENSETCLVEVGIHFGYCININSGSANSENESGVKSGAGCGKPTLSTPSFAPFTPGCLALIPGVER